MKASLARGLHVAPGQAANALAYDGWVGRWSRLFVPMVISAAEVAPGCRVLDISTGTGEAALMTLPTVGASGFVIGADIARDACRRTRPVKRPVVLSGSG
jgi:ubiquinone/menaquinone biosynthesis C-methylase UbiE